MGARWFRSCVLASILLVGFGLTGSARAACVGPSIGLEGSAFSPGGSITVHGENWTPDCNDTVSCSTGCGGGCVGGEPNRPMQDIDLVLRPTPNSEGDPVVLVEGMDAASDLTFDVDVVVPDGTIPGRYRVVARAQGFRQARGPIIEVSE